MKMEHIMDAMDYIDPALIAAADAPAPRRNKTRWLRPALIAACLCLALAGTAFAAQRLGVRIVDGGGEERPDVWLEGGIAYYPVDGLSDELRALENEHTYRSFDSWQEAEAFIGADLMNNPVLDASPATNFSVRYVEEENGIDICGRFLVSTSVGLDYVRLDGCYEMGDVDLTVEAQLYTDRMTDKAPDWDERFYGLKFSEGTQTSLEPYTASNGLEAQILEIDRPHKDTCLAACSLNGIPFIVKAHSDNSLEEAREALYQVLDGFVLN